MNNLHSKIISYPIDLSLFPKAESVSFMEFELTENQYIYIPKLWYHWIYTDPNTISLHYNFSNNLSMNDCHQNNDLCDLFYQDLQSNLPFTGVSHTNHTINADIFYKENESIIVHGLYGETEDMSPVHKTGNPNDSKYFKIGPISDFVKDSITTQLYIYMGLNPLTMNYSIYDKFSSIKSIILSDYDYNVNKPTLWMNLSKKVNSGLHYDNNSSLIYILSGKKKILLAKPNQSNQLYIQPFPAIIIHNM